MLLFLFLYLSLSCNFIYSLSNHDPFYLEQSLEPGEILCINTTVEYTSFVFNSLGNSFFKAYDHNNNERFFGYDEMIKEAAGISFGKMIGSLVITNPKKVNESSLSSISIAAISFPTECDIKIITNQMKSFIYFTFEDNTVCYFNGNGLHYRYQFFVSEGTFEIRPPLNLSQNIFVDHFYDTNNYNFLDVKSTVRNVLFESIEPHTIYINHSLAYSNDHFDIPTSFVRVDNYPPLIVYKHVSTNNSILSKTYFIEAGAKNRNTFPFQLAPHFINKEPGIFPNNKDDPNDSTDLYNSSYYGCDPYLFTYDSDGRKVRIGKDGRTANSYDTEILVKTIISGLLFQFVQISLFVYLISFCCICPCCCCYSCCRKAICCTVKHQGGYQSFNGQGILNFMQSGNIYNGASSIENVNEENNGIDNNQVQEYQEATNNYVSNYSINHNDENAKEDQPDIQEEEEVTDNDDAQEDIDSDHSMQDLDDTQDTHESKPQL